jgi:hypothetical protein
LGIEQRVAGAKGSGSNKLLNGSAQSSKSQIPKLKQIPIPKWPNISARPSIQHVLRFSELETWSLFAEFCDLELQGEGNSTDYSCPVPKRTHVFETRRPRAGLEFLWTQTPG